MSQDLSFLDMSIVKVLWDDNTKKTSIDIVKIDNFYLNEFKNNIDAKINNFTTDIIPIGNSNKFITSNIYNNDLNISKSLISSNIFASNLNINSQEKNIANFFYSSEPILIITSNNIGIGTNEPKYKLDINGNLNASNIFINNINFNNNTSNISSNVFNYLIIGSSNEIYSNASNYIISKLDLLNTDLIEIGINNKFITNNIYDNDLKITGILNVSNIITSNITVNGSSTTIETDIYITEKLEIINDSSDTSLIVKQLDINHNIAEFYNNTNPTFIITSNSNIGIGIFNPNLNYAIDINGKLNANHIYINNSNINDKIDNIIDIINNNYCKKTTFYFNTNTSFIYNDNIYYTYNIQLDKFIRFINIEENDKLYKFRIHTSKFNSKFNENNIKECDYLIMMSYLKDDGLNVRAIGLPEDLYLQNIKPWKIVKSNTFGIITYISPEENASILCTIIDEL